MRAHCCGDGQAAIDAAKKAAGTSGLDIESFLIMPVRRAGRRGAYSGGVFGHIDASLSRQVVAAGLYYAR
jgi:hypothetical protein